MIDYLVLSSSSSAIGSNFAAPNNLPDELLGEMAELETHLTFKLGSDWGLRRMASMVEREEEGSTSEISA